MHLPRRLASPSVPAPSIQLALDLNSRRAERLGPNHHLWRNGRRWWIAYTLLHDGWRQERIRHSLGTTDVDDARRRRDVILGHWRGLEAPGREELAPVACPANGMPTTGRSGHSPALLDGGGTPVVSAGATP